MTLRGSLLLCFLILSTFLYAQVDTVKRDTTRLIDKIQHSRASEALMHSITRSNLGDTIFNAKSEDIFMRHQGRIIRHIYINHIGFDKTMYDTTRNFKNVITRVGNALHSNTKDWVIRDNLFISEGDQLNPYKLADNERYLRDLGFILDARIKVKRVRGDSVDLIVTTRDVFSLGASASPRDPTRYKFKIRDNNLAGWGQRLQINGLVQGDRDPIFGSDIIYTKSSLGGTLTNLSVGFTTLNTGSSYGEENEYAAYLRLDRPLISPYSRLAGGLELSHNWSANTFHAEDSLFRRYNYNVTDLWGGYNIGINSNIKNRVRHFISARIFQQKFPDRPIQDSLNPIYNDQKFVLGQFTFFKQNFYKTRYIYGFGRTEDVPYGYNISLVTGWTSQLYLKRFYLGTNVEHTIANKKGDFYQYLFRGGLFLRESELQDVSLLFSASINTRLYMYKHVTFRQYFRLGYTAIINHKINPLLYLDNDYGVHGLSADSLRGVQRVGFHTETVFYTKWKLLGFRFAPLVFGDIGFLPKGTRHIFYSEPYYGLGLGIRTRNENLIFGTVEARCSFYPRVEDGSYFKLSLRTNLKIKSTGNLVRAPGFNQYN